MLSSASGAWFEKAGDLDPQEVLVPNSYFDPCPAGEEIHLGQRSSQQAEEIFLMQKTRDSFPDVLRGFALLGIAMVNVQYFAVDTVSGFEAADLSAPVNSAAAFIVMFIFQSKFYLLFSFLFGYSAHYVIKDAKANARRWVGRSIGLLILGLFHAVFLFHGDILFLYGAFALILLAFYFKSERTITRWAKGIYIAIGVLFSVVAVLAFVGELFLASKGKTLPSEAEGIDGLNVALASAGFLETAAARFEVWLAFLPQGALVQGPLVMVAFLVGVLVARKDGLAKGADPKLMRRMASWGFAIGLPLQLLAAVIYIVNLQAASYSLGLSLISLAINFLTAPILSAGYVGTLWLVSEKLGGMALLSAAGRHSLTIYLSQSVIFSVLFSAWGLGLFAELDASLVAATAGLVWLALSLLAMLNLNFRQRGPMEALLTGFSRLFERGGHES